MLRSATVLSVLLLAAFVLLLLSVVSTPIIRAIPLGSFQDVKFGALGYCKGNVCSPIKIGYDMSHLFDDDSSFNIPAAARNTLSSILVVHPAAAGVVLINLIFALIAHFHKAGHSSRYLLGLFIISLIGFLVSLLAFLVDVLVFVPHLAWGSYLVLAAAVLVLISGIMSCIMRRSIAGRKARREKVEQNPEMNGRNYFASTNPPVPAVSGGTSTGGLTVVPQPSIPAVSGVSPPKTFATFNSRPRDDVASDDRVPLTGRSPHKPPTKYPNQVGPIRGPRPIDPYGNSLAIGSQGLEGPRRAPSNERMRGGMAMGAAGAAMGAAAAYRGRGGASPVPGRGRYGPPGPGYVQSGVPGGPGGLGGPSGPGYGPTGPGYGPPGPGYSPGPGPASRGGFAPTTRGGFAPRGRGYGPRGGYGPMRGGAGYGPRGGPMMHNGMRTGPPPPHRTPPNAYQDSYQRPAAASGGQYVEPDLGGRTNNYTPPGPSALSHAVPAAGGMAAASTATTAYQAYNPDRNISEDLPRAESPPPLTSELPAANMQPVTQPDGASPTSYTTALASPVTAVASPHGAVPMGAGYSGLEGASRAQQQPTSPVNPTLQNNGRNMVPGLAVTSDPHAPDRQNGTEPAGGTTASNPMSLGTRPSPLSQSQTADEVTRTMTSQTSHMSGSFQRSRAGSVYLEDVEPRFAGPESPLDSVEQPSLALPVTEMPPPPLSHEPIPLDSDMLLMPYDDNPAGSRSPAGSERSNFTSISQRGINPRWNGGPPNPPTVVSMPRRQQNLHNYMMTHINSLPPRHPRPPASASAAPSSRLKPGGGPDILNSNPDFQLAPSGARRGTGTIPNSAYPTGL